MLSVKLPKHPKFTSGGLLSQRVMCEGSVGLCLHFWEDCLVPLCPLAQQDISHSHRCSAAVLLSQLCVGCRSTAALSPCCLSLGFWCASQAVSCRYQGQVTLLSHLYPSWQPSIEELFGSSSRMIRHHYDKCQIN